MARILAVAADEAFAKMLKEGLESLGPHKVDIRRSESEAVAIVTRQQIDLTIIDADLEDADPVGLVRSIRQMRPDMPVMWMPFLGSDLSDEMMAVDVQGILTKPFFMEDLPGCIEAALAQSQAEPLAPAPSDVVDTEAAQVISAPAETMSRPPEFDDVLSDPHSVQRRLDSLVQSLSAESAVVISRKGRLLAWAGFAGHRAADELARVLVAELEAANSVAAVVGERSGRFANCVFEGDESRLFSMSIPDKGMILSVVLKTDTPLGTVRYQVKQAAADLNGVV